MKEQQKSLLPEIIPITRQEDEHSFYMGLTEDGCQFWGYTTFFFTKPHGEFPSEQWASFRREYVVLHFFDKDGNYIKTDYTYLGLTKNVNEGKIISEFEKLLLTIGDFEYSDIKIKLFQVMIDENIFGLVPDEVENMINLQPSSTISFLPPWDGEYYT